MRPQHASGLALLLSCACASACSPPKIGSTSTSASEDPGEDTDTSATSTSTSEESSSEESSGEASSSESGEDPDPPECTAPNEFGFLNLAVGDYEFATGLFGPGTFAYACTVQAVQGTLDYATAELECPELNPAPQQLWLSFSGEPPDLGLPLSPGQNVELRSWVGGSVLALDIREQDTLAPLLTALTYDGNDFSLLDFLDGGGPEPGFLAPYAIEQIDLGCPLSCDPGGGDFLPGCQECSKRMGVAISVDGLPAEQVASGVVALLPADEPRVAALPRSAFRTSEDCDYLDGETTILLLALP